MGPRASAARASRPFLAIVHLITLARVASQTAVNYPFNASEGRYARERQYTCEPDASVRGEACVAVGLTSAVVARPHPVHWSRALAPDKRRVVVDALGTPRALNDTWRDGDRLAPSPSGDEVRDSPRVFALAFEMLALLRNHLFFHADQLTPERWAHLHRPLTDCGLESDAAVAISASYPEGRRVSRDAALDLARDPWNHGGDVAPHLEHYAAAVQADFLCLVIPELSRAPEFVDWIPRERCLALRGALGVAPGVVSQCWHDAYRGHFADGGMDYPFALDWNLAPWPQSAPWDARAKASGIGYRPVRPLPAGNGTVGPLLRVGDHTHDSTNAGGGVGGSPDRPPGLGDRVGSTLTDEELLIALKSIAASDNPSMRPGNRPYPHAYLAAHPIPFEPALEGPAAYAVVSEKVTVPGAVVTAEVASSIPGWPARVAFSAWREVRGGSRAQRAGLRGLCVEIRDAAVALGMGGACRLAEDGTVEGAAEGTALAARRLADWMPRRFHRAYFRGGPKLTAPGETLAGSFEVPPEG